MSQDAVFWEFNRLVGLELTTAAVRIAGAVTVDSVFNDLDEDTKRKIVDAIRESGGNA